MTSTNFQSKFNMSDAVKAIAAAIDEIGPQVLQSHATRALENQISSAIRTDIALSVEQQAKITEEIGGIPFISTHKKAGTSDHLRMAVKRELVRCCYEKEKRPQVTNLPTLVVGSTANDILKYWKNKNFFFHVHVDDEDEYGEGKDPGRTVVKLLGEVADALMQTAETDDNVSLNSLPKNKKSVTARLRDIRGLMRFFERVCGIEGVKRNRIFVGTKDVENSGLKFVQLLFNDSGYNLTEADWYYWFDVTGAVEADVIQFMPPEMFFEHKPESDEYTYRQRPAADLTKWSLVTAGLSAVGATAAIFSGNVPAFLALSKLAMAMWGAAKTMKAVKGLSKKNLAALGIMEFKKVSSGFPTSLTSIVIGSIFGMAGALVEHLCGRIATVTYKEGPSNGYRHSRETWGLLGDKIVLESPYHSYMLYTEIRQQMGEMWWIRLNKTNVVEATIREIPLIRGTEYVMILDIPKCIEEGWLGSDFVGCGHERFFAASASDWYDTLNFLATLDKKSLTFGNVMTMVKRAQAGLAIGTTTYMKPWKMPKEDMWKFALAALCEAMRLDYESTEFLEKHAKGMVENAYLSKFELLKGKILGMGLTVMTLGVANLFADFFCWLLKKERVVFFAKDMPRSILQEYNPSDLLKVKKEIAKSRGTFKGDPSNFIEYKLDVNSGRVAKTCSCEFVADLGDIGKQEVFCMHEPGQKSKKVKISYSREEMQALRTKMVGQRDSEADKGPLHQLIDKCIDALEPHMGGIEFELELELLIGGFGTGKSFIARKMIQTEEVTKENACLVYTAFSKLAVDYPTQAAPGSQSYKFYTTHKAWSVRGINTVFMDEYTAMEHDLGLLGCFMMNAKKLVLIGDESQTGVMPEEGLRFFTPKSKIRFQDARAHCLSWNFRNDMFTVALANYRYGYCLYANSDEIQVPQIKPFEEYHGATGPIMTFSKATARAIGQSEGKENTVRTNQGQTVDHSFTALMDQDAGMLRNSALAIVNISRHRKTHTYYVDVTSPSYTELRKMLCLDVPEFMDNIAKWAKPDLEAHYGKKPVAKISDLSKIIDELAEEGLILQVDVDKEEKEILAKARSVEETIKQAFPTRRRTQCEDCGCDITATDVSFCERCWDQKLAVKRETIAGRLQDLNNIAPMDDESIRSDTDTDITLMEQELELRPGKIGPDISDRLDFRDGKDGRLWCTARAITSEYVESERDRNERTKGLSKKRLGEEAYNQAREHQRMDSMVPPDKLLGYKEWVTEKEGPGRGESNIAVTTLTSYLDSQDIGYVIFEMSHADPNRLRKSHTSIKSLMTFLVGIEGHMEPMDLKKVMMFMEGFSITVQSGTKEEKIRVHPMMTVDDLNKETKREVVDCREMAIPVHKTVVEHCLFGLAFKNPKIMTMPTSTYGGWGVGGDWTTIHEVESPELKGHALVLGKMHSFTLPYDKAISAEPETPQFVMSKLNPGGRDAYLMAPLLDPTTERTTRMNDVGAALGPQKKLKGVRVNADALIMSVNRRGHPESDEDRYWSFSGGNGLWQTNSNWEAMGCVQRYKSRVSGTTRPSREGINDAKEMARKLIKERYDVANMKFDEQLERGIEVRFFQDARKRNYDGRYDIDYLKLTPSNSVTFSNKAQFKPLKGGDLKLSKVGQGISATCPETNLEFGSLFRILSARCLRAGNKDNFYDCHMDEDTFRSRFNQRVSTMGPTKRPIVVDGDEFDSRHNWHSRQGELTFWTVLARSTDRLFSMHPWDPIIRHLARYMKEKKENYPIIKHGLMKAVIPEAKPSGGPDTLPGNSITQEMYANRVVKSAWVERPRKVTAKKGDDYLAYLSAPMVDEVEMKKCAMYSPMRLRVIIGEAEFCGRVVTRQGMFDNVIRRMNKALAYGAKTYKNFAEFQISVRDTLDRIRKDGVEETVVATALGSNCTISYATAALQVLHSIGHISEDQWREAVKQRVLFKPMALDGKCRPRPYGTGSV